MPTLNRRAALVRHTALLLSAAYLAGCSSPAPSGASLCTPVSETVYDPAQSFNRSIFAFNRAVDDYALAPVARGYRHLPDLMQHGVHNFASNFGEPKVFINDLLQGNPQRSVNTLGRFALNTTVGVLGLINVSDPVGIPRHSADFGQTFGVWGIGAGPIVELPLLGNGNSRDSVGKVLNLVVDPFGSNSDTVRTLSTVALVGGTIDGRAALLPLTDSLQQLPDYYGAMRSVIAEHRAAFVREGRLGATEPVKDHCEGSTRDDF
ncbi:VacJ family lipoprotein [Pseudomonas sp. Fl5BN2]|uniref:MlaA family lipoprotein n=1 Tax=unclassified Pseudomonas TaxID=196821 RepID=UPI0013789A00|nr:MULTISPECIES: VacJ family lipoprotein [unclassified Pseudomonas]NBF03419.1 VacJ family lipoprotein [Pseudomonas sp. Fl5BN2]NBF10951.1 VacJ family lipoprotein [Pseudomonas sp. Fl4BN1]